MLIGPVFFFTFEVAVVFSPFTFLRKKNQNNPYFKTQFQHTQFNLVNK